MGDTLAGAGIGGALGAIAGAILAPEITLPALLGSAFLGGAGGAGLGYAINAIENSPETIFFTAAAIGLAVYAAKKL